MDTSGDDLRRFPHPLGWKDVALVLLVVAVVGGSSLLWPFGRDQGNYAYPAWRWLEGQMPYRDVYVFKPPLTVTVHAASQLLFGHSIASIRALDLALQGWTAVVLAWMAAATTGRRAAGWTAGGAYAVAFYGAGHWHTAQTDGWFAPLFATAMLLGLAADRAGGRRRLALWATAGALIGVAFLGKYTALGLGLPLAVVALGDPRRSVRRVLAAGGAALGGFIALLAAAAAAMAAMGFLDAFLETQREMMGPYARTASVSYERMIRRRLPGALRRVFPVAAWGAVAIPVAAWLGRRRWHLVWVAVAWTVAGALSAVVQRRAFTYHFMPMLPGLAVTLSVGLHLLLEACRVPRLGQAAVAAALVGWFGVAAVDLEPYAIAWRGLVGEQTWEESLVESRSRSRGLPFADQMAVADWIAAHTEPEDPVFVWSFNPAVMFLAERRQVSRFLYHYPLLVDWHEPADREELLEALRAEPPAVFVVASGDAFGHVTHAHGRSEAAFRRFRALSRWVEAHYEPSGEVGVYKTYRRRMPAGPPASEPPGG